MTRPFDLLCGLIALAIGGREPDAALVTAVAAPTIDWPRLVTLSGVHLLTPALGPALRHPSLRGSVPEELQAYLDAMLAAAAERNLKLRGQLAVVTATLNRIGIVPVALKGAIRLLDGLWPDPAFRFMHDLDLLVPEAAIAGCGQALAREGWRTAEDGTDAALHHWSMVHPEGVARIELHRLPLSAPHARLLPAEAMLASATERTLDGAKIAVPSLSHQLVHLVAHGLLQHAQLESGRFLLRDLAEQALLTERAGRDNLWSVRERFVAARHGLAWEVAGHLCALCLLAHAEPVGPAARMLAARMLLQQRSRWAMQTLGPVGWLTARLAGVATAGPTLASLPSLARQLQLFRSKTMW